MTDRKIIRVTKEQWSLFRTAMDDWFNQMNELQDVNNLWDDLEPAPKHTDAQFDNMVRQWESVQVELIEENEELQARIKELEAKQAAIKAWEDHLPMWLWMEVNLIAEANWSIVERMRKWDDGTKRHDLLDNLHKEATNQ